MLQQVKIGGHGAVGFREGVYVQDVFLVSFEDSTCLVGYLLHCLGAYRGFAEYCRNLLRLYGFDNLGDLLWSTFVSSVDGPEVEFLHVGVAAQVRERSLAGHKRALALRQGAKLLNQVRGDVVELLFVCVAVGFEVLGVVRDKVAKRADDILDIDFAVCGRHPRMRIGLTLVVTLGDGDGGDAFAEVSALCLRVGNKAFKPALKPQAVVEDELGLLRTLEVVGRGLVVVDFGTSLGDGFYLAELARNARSHVLDHGEGGQDEGSRGVLVLRGVCASSRIAWTTCGEKSDGGRRACAEQGEC